MCVCVCVYTVGEAGEEAKVVISKGASNSSKKEGEKKLAGGREYDQRCGLLASGAFCATIFLVVAQQNVETHADARIHKHTHAHARTHTHTHAHARTHKHTRNTHVHTHVHTRANTHVHTHTHTHTKMCVRQ